MKTTRPLMDAWTRCCRETPDGVQLFLKVVPRASRNAVEPPLGDRLRVRVTAPPVEEAANQAVVELLAHCLGCAVGRVRVVQGRTARLKTVRLAGFTAAEVRAALGGAGIGLDGRANPRHGGQHDADGHPADRK